MIRKMLFTLFIVTSVVLLASCDTQQASPTPEANMPNPASVYCEENGGKVELREDASGGAVGICVFVDGSECDEWAYFRGECKPGGTPQTDPTPTPVPTEQASRPSDPVSARDAILAYLVEKYGAEAPAADLSWAEKHAKPEGLVGEESYEYTAGDWLIAISYPVVAPENVFYTVTVTNQVTGFHWEGKVDAQEQVTETSAETDLGGDGWKIYRNETLGYRFQYPSEAEIITADNPLQTLTILGPGMGDEYWGISHPSNREEYRPPEGADLFQWLMDHNLAGEKRLADVQIAGTTAIHFQHERSPQSYADDRYYFISGGQLYLVLIGHGDTEDWELNNRFLQSFQFEDATSDTSALTTLPTPLPFDVSDYQGFWTYIHPEYNFSIMLPEDWIVEEITTSDPLMNGHTLSLYPRLQEQGVEGLLIRMAFRRVGEDALLWPTGVGEGECIPQGTLDVAGQPVRRIYYVCPTGQVNSIWYQGGENQPNIQRSELEFGFILTLTGFYCEGDHSLDGKVQRVGEMIIASLKVL
jgi:putative hemolysin